MRHLKPCDLESRLCTFPGGQYFSFPEPVRRNRFATAFTVFILPSLLCFTTVLTGTRDSATQVGGCMENSVCLSAGYGACIQLASGLDLLVE